VLNAIVVGSTDPQLEGLFKAAGTKPTSLTESGLGGLAKLAIAPDIFVFDLRGQTILPSVIQSVRRQHPTATIMVVLPSLEPTLLMQAMHAGVTEVLADPLTQVDVESAIARATEKLQTTQSGQVFGFVGAKGGVGTTTVAVNVASVLGGISKPNRTLLVDLHQSSGDTAVFLGADVRLSIVEALENTHRLDQAFLRSIVTPVGQGLDLLASPERPVASQGDVARLRTVLGFLPTVYRYTVLDLPRSDATALDALDNLDRIIIVANQELATVRNASRIAATLRQRYGPERLLAVISRSDRHADIGQAEIERAIGTHVEHVFPSDYRTALQALHKGRPLTLDNHNDLSGELTRFAYQLAGVEAKPPAERPGRKFGLFGSNRRS
jgi:pilus assembly protein CpaE